METILTLHCNRIGYTKQCIQHLLNLDGINECNVIIVVEPIDQQVIDYLKFAPFKRKELIVNDRQLGCNWSVRKCLEIGSNFDSMFMVEDDILLAKDTLTYSEIVKKAFCEYQSFYNRHYDNIDLIKRETPGKYEYAIRDNFCSWGWWGRKSFVSEILTNSKICDSSCIFCQDAMNLFTPPQNKYHPHYNQFSKRIQEAIKNEIYHESWDIYVNEMMVRENMKAYYPLISRSQNIGAHGINIDSVEEHSNNQHVKYWRENWPISL